jgi:hypothetical protein
MTYPDDPLRNLAYADALSSADEVAIYQGGELVRVELGQLRAKADEYNTATKTDFENEASSVNTTNKFSGRLVYDSTSRQYLYAKDSSPYAPWWNFRNLIEYVPGAPKDATIHYGYTAMASFTHCHPNFSCSDGMILDGWFKSLVTSAGDVVVIDGFAGAFYDDYLDMIDTRIANRIADGSDSQTIDYGIWDLTGEFLGMAKTGSTDYQAKTLEGIGKLESFCSKVYALAYPPLPPLETSLTAPGGFFQFEGPEWDAKRAEYDEFIETQTDAQLVRIWDGYTPTYTVTTATDPYQDYHVNSQSAYNAALLLYRTIVSNYA